MFGLISAIAIGVIVGIAVGGYLAIEHLRRSSKACIACGRRWNEHRPHGSATVRVIRPDESQPDARPYNWQGDEE